jgi:hypothetical protein
MVTAIDHLVERRKSIGNASRPDLLQHVIEGGKTPGNDTRMSMR